MTGGKTETAGYGIHLHSALFNARHKWMKAILCWQLLKVLRLYSSSTSVKCVFLSSHGNLLQLSIWDLRMNNNGGCVQRISGSIGDVIYSVCSSPSGLIAIGGTDRAVTIYDPRRLVWFCCLVLMIIWATAYKNALCLSCASRTFYSFFLLYPVWRMGIKTVRAFSQLVESI